MMNDKIVTELAEAHWKYIEELLYAHNEKTSSIAKCRFHYISAFTHGWKHAKENSEGK